MKKYLVIVKFTSVHHFCRFYEHVLSGHVFLPLSNILPDHSKIILKILVPLLEASFFINGIVVSGTEDPQSGSGMTIDIRQGLKTVLPEIIQKLSVSKQYQDILDLQVPETDELTDLKMDIFEDEIHISEDNHSVEKQSSPSCNDSTLLSDDLAEGLIDLKMKNESVSKEFIMDLDTADPAVISSENQGASGILYDDLIKIVEQEEIEFELEKEPEVSVATIPEKKDLTPEEREKAEPVGQFFMNLTKAMLRSGYYAPGHPGGVSAKAGLYDEFIGVLGSQREIMITNHSSRDVIDLMLTGILDEPISIRVLVGPGVAELFAPKLNEYCERKRLLSFALKRDIQPDHFYQFIDIMSDPKVDDHKDKEAGKYLTNAFIEHGITDISTVFIDDMVALESDLPWRVEMAIHRLAKDLKVMPMFKGVSSDAIKKIKLQTVQDIIRPLKHPAYLNDFLVNCYIIAKYARSMTPEDVEEIVVDAFSIHLLLPTSRFTFKELDHLEQLKKEHPGNIQIDRRLNGIKRILKLISRRVLIENEPGAQIFLGHLYENDILSFNELPTDVQYMINTRKLADDIRDNFSKYSKIVSNTKDPDELLVYLKCFKRAVPILIDFGNWEILRSITQVIKSVSLNQSVNSDQMHFGLKIKKLNKIEDFSESKLFKSFDVLERPVVFIFKDVADKIISAYENTDPNQRKEIDKIINDLGAFGVDIVGRILANSSNREIRKLSYEKMISKGDPARKWAINVLDDTSQQWFIYRNAMMILGKVSDKEGDFSCARKFLEHANPKIREEVLNLSVSLKPHDGETLVVKAFNDEAPKVRWRAMRILPEFAPISESTMIELLTMITLPVHQNAEAADKHIKKTVHIISTINAMTVFPSPRKVEAAILELLKSFSGGKKSLWHKVKRAVGHDHESLLLKAAIPLLGKTGGDQSESFLKKIIPLYPDLSEIIKKALLQKQ